MRVGVFLGVLCFFCGIFSFEVAAQPSPCALPSLLLVLDTSGSMSQHNKFDMLKMATQKFLGAYEGKLRMGLLTYSDKKAQLEVQIGPLDPKDAKTHSAAIFNKLSSAKVFGDTPMRSSLQAAISNFKSFLPTDPAHQQTDPQKRKHTILLFSDGESTDGSPLEEIKTLRSFQVGAKNYDIKVYVVNLHVGGLNIPGFEMEQYAIAGGTQKQMSAVSEKELIESFLTIGKHVEQGGASCPSSSCDETHPCGEGTICNKQTGACVPLPCQNNPCATDETCVDILPDKTQCKKICDGVKCPDGQECSAKDKGACVAKAPCQADVDCDVLFPMCLAGVCSRPTHPPQHTSGCQCAVVGGDVSVGGVWWVFLVMGWVFWRRKRVFGRAV